LRACSPLAARRSPLAARHEFEFEGLKAFHSDDDPILNPPD
jgi:hypothetical protein